MSLRLSTGFCHGLVLQSPAAGTRPTAARVRAAVWNALQERLAGSRVLDIFAGSGAVGIEALSRGAVSATFIEMDREALRALKTNLEAVSTRAQKQGLHIETRILGQTAVAALKQCPEGAFDIIWLDPPYAALLDLLPQLISGLERCAAPSCQLIIESEAGAHDAVAELLGSVGSHWELVKQKVYGNIAVSFFNRMQEA